MGQYFNNNDWITLVLHSILNEKWETYSLKKYDNQGVLFLRLKVLYLTHMNNKQIESAKHRTNESQRLKAVKQLTESTSSFMVTGRLEPYFEQWLKSSH